MDDNEAKSMMRRCIDEITTLRARVAVLEPKALAYEQLSLLMDLLPKRSQSMGVHLEWMLEKRIAEIDVAAAEAKEEAG